MSLDGDAAAADQAEIERRWALADKARGEQRATLYAAMAFGALALVLAWLWPGSPLSFISLVLAGGLTLVQLALSIRSQFYERSTGWLLLAITGVCATIAFSALTFAANSR